MAYQREHRQAAPDHGRRIHDHSRNPVAPPYQTPGASQPTVPALASSPPAADFGVQRIVCEDAKAIEYTGLRQDEVYLFDHHQGNSAAQEESYLDAAHSPFDEAQTPICICGPRCHCKPACMYEIHSCPCAPLPPRSRPGGHENAPPSRSFEVTRSDSAQQSFSGMSLKRTVRPFPEAHADRGYFRMQMILAKQLRTT